MQSDTLWDNKQCPYYDREMTEMRESWEGEGETDEQNMRDMRGGGRGWRMWECNQEFISGPKIAIK